MVLISMSRNTITYDINAKYKAMNDTHIKIVVFKVSDQIWTILTHDRFLVGEYNKLKKRKIGHYEVL